MQHRDLNRSDTGAGWPLGDYCVQIPTLEDGRRFLGPPSEDARHARSQAYWQQAQMRSRGRLRLGMHDRGEEFMLANGSICEADLDGHRNHLPLHVRVLRQHEIRIAQGETLDLTASHTWWDGLDSREELYVLLQVDRLIVEPGARLTVRGNVCVGNIGHLIADPPAGPEQAPVPQFEIHVCGTAHAAYSALRDAPSEDGRDGLDGLPGRTARERTPEPSLLGPLGQATILEPATDGQDGLPGQDGTGGQNGGLAMVADIRIGRISGFAPKGVRVFGQASAGQPGGNGGRGGRGGDGGNGRTHAARGGDGGAGGDGGHGGNGGLAGNIFVELPADDRDRVETCSKDSLGGRAGRGGRGGDAGRNGMARDAGAAQPTAPARPGRDGRDGRPGRGRPGPNIHLLLTPPAAQAAAADASQAHEPVAP